ncbi:hypothetical protein [Bacteriovorax sp. Seq25_V]|uniref:hypothetical protein n=1 Tax=Bacteriovorax sp. Seq25_V TaxID=1201288 RepID=UPI00055901E8|nr:hypothetical protein [Bacteriovorax sp. Seq25_V]
MKKLEKKIFIKLFIGQILISLVVFPLLATYIMTFDSSYFTATSLSFMIPILTICFNVYIFAGRFLDLELSPYFGLIAIIPTVSFFVGIALCFMDKIHSKNILNLLKKLEN